jgi:uncharacterized protein YbaR (Trm112 family)
MSKLLLDETPLMVLPSLVAEVGLHEAIVLQQLHYLITGKFGKIINGQRYIYKTYQQWQADYFPFWHVDTVRKTFRNIEKAGYVMAIQEKSYYRQKLYTINYEKVDAMRTNSTHPCGQIARLEADKSTSSIQREDYTKTTGAANAAPIIADIPAMADVANSTDMSSPKRDALEDIFFRATKTKTHRDTINAWRGAEHLKDTCAALCDATGLPVQKGDSGKWLKGAVALHELGVTSDILKRVWNEATERDRQFLTHPQAFTERVRGVIAKQRSQPAQDIADSVPVMLENGDIEYRRVTK